MDQPLRGVVVVIPEYREQSLLQRMLEERGAVVLCCPMVAITDHPDQAAVQLWLEQLCAGDMDIVVLYTGEGLRRLIAAAERLGLLESTLQAMARIPLVTRGPKPVRACARWGLSQHFRPQPLPQKALWQPWLRRLPSMARPLAYSSMVTRLMRH